MQVGFIGLRSPIAANRLAAGHDLTVYNRTKAKAEQLVKRGAQLAKTPGDAARGDVVITMLADDHAVDQAVFAKVGILAALAPGAIHVSMSTISVALSERLDSAHREKRQEFVSAPVFGRPDAAASANLFVVPAGKRETVATCQPLFDAIGQRTFPIGGKPPMANLVKLSGNFLIASVIEALGEAFALIGKAGVDRAQYLDILTNTLFGAPVYKTYGKLIAEERYTPAGFSVELGYKDVGLALNAALELKVPMPLASLISDRFVALLASRSGDLDWSALALIAKRDAGGETPLHQSE
jgi:3-hydroxyisobutyrate dehydrogenase-like beta-hydroxyacid dehydrogenase